MSFQRGSTWNKWDLHVHSPESYHQSFGLDRDVEPGETTEEAIWGRYIDELEALEEISCVGITDYFSVEGYKRVRREIEEDGRLDNLDLVIPNVELRVNNIVESRKSGTGDAIEVHVLFSDELEPSTIENEFLGKLDAKDPNGNDIAIQKQSLIELGNNEKFDDFVGDDDPYLRGCKLITVQWESIMDAISRNRIDGKAMAVVVKKDGWDDLEFKGRSGSERSQFVAQTDAFFVQKDEERDWYLGKDGGMTPESFAEQFGSKVPGIRGSDTHSFDNFCYPDESRFCWIKADTTWEGLKQIKYEPETRVKIGPENPQRRVSIHTPDKLQIRNGKVNDRLEIADTTLPLNANLITVIGGKGAGKTALLDLLANCFENQHVPNAEVSDDAESFIERAQKGHSANSVKTRLEFAGSDVEPFVKKMLDDEEFTRSRIEYLPQGQIAEFCRDDDEMHEQVLELVKKAMENDHADVLGRFEETRNDIGKIVEKLETRTNELQELDPETIDARINEVMDELDAISGNIEDKKEEIEEFRQVHTDELHEGSINEIEENLEEAEERLGIATSILDKLELQRERLDEIRSFDASANQIRRRANDLELDISPSSIDYDALEAEVEEHINKVSAHIDDIEERQMSLKQDLNGLQDVNGELSQLRTELRRLKNERQSILERKQELVDINAKISDLRDQRREEFHQYLRLYDRLRTVYSEMISHFQEGKSEILEDVEFRAELHLYDDVQSSIYELLDGRSVNFEELTGAVNALSKATNIPDDAHQLIDDYIEEMLQYSSELKEGSSQAEYERRIFTDHLKIGERILLDGTPMSRLSLGQKGTVLLKILLAEDDKPLIIDQPEENLDNRFIYDTLRNAFREAKTDRQVIIATHNANLVVNTDAEQVIVAKYNDNVISFESGALENPNIRTQVAKILEGGRDAFVKREQKYNFNP